MTKRYTDHANQAEKQIHINKLPVFTPSEKKGPSEKKKVKKLKDQILKIKATSVNELKSKLAEILKEAT